MSETKTVWTDLDPHGDATLSADDAADREFSALLDRRDVHMVFQPLVDLRSGEVVALEALVRGPESTQFASPFALFNAARRAGRVAELDWVCRAAAFRAFLEAGVPPAMSLFVNVEPEAIASECPTDLVHYVTRAESVLRVFVEVNDRALATDPAGVMAAVDRAREMGWGIAIDDVGSSRAPLAMLPIVGADVVKLDLRRLGDASQADSCAIVTSVLRHIEQTRATLLVEGIETEDDARWARAMGAVYGQGHHFGLPGPLHAEYTAPRAPVRLINIVLPDLDVVTPFELLHDLPRQKMSRKHLDDLARVLAYSPRSDGSWPVFLTCIGRDEQIPPEMIEHGIPRETLLFVTFGIGLPSEPAPGVRGVSLRRDDPLADERLLIVLNGQAPVAIFARASSDGLFEVVVTQNSELVLEIAHHLIRRVPGPGRANAALRILVPVHKPEAEDAVAPPADDGHPSKKGWLGRWGST